MNIIKSKWKKISFSLTCVSLPVFAVFIGLAISSLTPFSGLLKRSMDGYSIFLGYMPNVSVCGSFTLGHIIDICIWTYILQTSGVPFVYYQKHKDEYDYEDSHPAIMLANPLVVKRKGDLISLKYALPSNNWRGSLNNWENLPRANILDAKLKEKTRYCHLDDSSSKKQSLLKDLPFFSSKKTKGATQKIEPPVLLLSNQIFHEMISLFNAFYFHILLAFNQIFHNTIKKERLFHDFLKTSNETMIKLENREKTP